MTVRRHALATAALTVCASLGVLAQEATRPTPREALGQLKAGNDRFARNASKPLSLSVNRRKDLAGGQNPSAMILSCADSRVPPELVFNAGLGDLLVIRSSGAVVDRSVLASIEYGASRLHIPLLVVMGHESCDVVRSATEAKGAPESANLDYLYKAIHAAKRENGEDRDELRSLILGNVEQVINDTLVKSPLVRRMVDAGDLEVVGAYYELVSGRVIFSDPVSPGVPNPAPGPTAGRVPAPAAAH
jgi:carbonic anhydrase